MKSDYPGLPNLIFGIRCSQFRIWRIKEFLTFKKVSFRSRALKATLLRRLVPLQTEYTPSEQNDISLWFLGNESTAELAKLKAPPSPQADPNPPPGLKSKGGVKSSSGAPQTVKAPPPVECTVCMDTLPVHKFPHGKLEVSCTHEPSVCLTCLAQSLQHQIADKPWDQVVCPECPATLSFKTVKKFATRESFKRYDQKSILSLFQTWPNFTMCLAPGCDSGQIHGGGDDQPIMTCTSCGFRTCFTHKLPWHPDETCKQYDARQTEKKKQEVASEKHLAKMTKVCPNPKCGLHVVKVSGCDHIYCTACRHEFCWACLASYQKIRGRGNSAHLRSCPYHSKNL